jgi:hypothetical protein
MNAAPTSNLNREGDRIGKVAANDGRAYKASILLVADFFSMFLVSPAFARKALLVLRVCRQVGQPHIFKPLNVSPVVFLDQHCNPEKRLGGHEAAKRARDHQASPFGRSYGRGLVPLVDTRARACQFGWRQCRINRKNKELKNAIHARVDKRDNFG